MQAPTDTEVFDRLYTYLQGSASFGRAPRNDQAQADEANEKHQREIALIWLFTPEERSPIQAAFDRGDMEVGYQMVKEALDVRGVDVRGD